MKKKTPQETTVQNNYSENINSMYLDQNVVYGYNSVYNPNHKHFDYIVNTPDIKPLPEAHITVNKSRLKRYGDGDKYFMQNNTEFELELYNPTSETLGVKITMNGKSVSTTHLVLYPGKRIFLDRPVSMNNERRFKFVTYEVDDDARTQYAIANNGNVYVEFFNEFKPHVYTCNYVHIDPYFNFIGSPVYGDSVYNTTCSTASINEPMKSSFNETGIIVPGSMSDTKFNGVDMVFETTPMEVERMKILPISQKPIEPKDLIKTCKNCKKRAKKDHNFCAKCGHEL